MTAPASVADRVQIIARLMSVGAWNAQARLKLIGEWGSEPKVRQAANEASRYISGDHASAEQRTAAAVGALERVQELALDSGDPRSLAVAAQAAGVLLGHSRSQTPPSVEAAIGTIRYLVEHDPGALRHALRECQQLLTEALGSAELAERVTADPGVRS